LSDRFEIVAEPVAGLKLLQRKRIGDHRGAFSRLFDAEDMVEFGWPGGVFQINESVTAIAGTVRGMHYQQPPFSEAKLVTCIRGSILDVAVDIRQGSATFLGACAFELSEENGCSLLIPEGFAHGFQSLVDDVRMIYVHSAPYRALSEGGLDPRDPALAIDWLLPVKHLSARDAGHPPIDASFRGVSL
jgi:dTDP-4-dehydrorhamnose 3,5-epimerase